MIFFTKKGYTVALIMLSSFGLNSYLYQLTTMHGIRKSITRFEVLAKTVGKHNTTAHNRETHTVKCSMQLIKKNSKIISLKKIIQVYKFSTFNKQKNF